VIRLFSWFVFVFVWWEEEEERERGSSTLDVFVPVKVGWRGLAQKEPPTHETVKKDSPTSQVLTLPEGRTLVAF
jgi:hypothetical protein